MARALIPGLTLAVVAAHWAVLQVLGSMLQAPTVLKTMATPFFTRELHSSLPVPPISPIPPVSAKSERKRAVAVAPPSKFAIDSVVKDTPETTTTETVTATQVTTPSQKVEQGAVAKASLGEGDPDVAGNAVATTDGAAGGATGSVTTETAQASSTGSVVGPTPVLPAKDDWPSDTRLSYKLTGNFRGPIGGEGRVQWQRQGSAYQVKVELDLSGITIFTMTSQGQVTPDGLEPSAYEEKRLGTQALQISMDASMVRLNDGKRVDRPPLAQDTASQFVELGHRFATGRAALAVGTNVKMWLVRPSAAAEWTYDIVALDSLTSVRLGTVAAYHLKPRPLDNPNGPVTAEMWFAPSLQYLPVRIKITLNTDTWVDLVIDKIEQAAPPERPKTEPPALKAFTQAG